MIKPICIIVIVTTLLAWLTLDQTQAEVILWEKDGAKMAGILFGSFEMGEEELKPNERPMHTVTLDQFYIDVHEVTVGQFRKFVKESAYAYSHWDDVATYSPTDEHPMILVTWNDATAYAEWAGKRLPSEAEFEYAARGGLEGKRYPWGDEITHDDANYAGTGGKDKWEHCAPVGSFNPNGYGLYDMAGNVFEWCADWYDATYYYDSPVDNPKGPNTGQYRVLRGGSWNNVTGSLRVAYRYDNTPGDKGRRTSYGFRCVSGSVTTGSLISFSSVPEIKVGDQFTVDVLVEDVVDLAGWQMDLLFSSDVLEVKQVEEGSFLKKGDAQTSWQPGEKGMKKGIASGINAAFLGQGGVSGTGKLLTFTFKAKLAGVCVLDLGIPYNEIRRGILYNPSGETILHRVATSRVTVVPASVVPASVVPVSISFSSVSEVKVDDQFTIDVLVEGVVDLAGWQMDLLFNSDILEVQQVEEGSFLKKGGGQTFWQPGKSGIKKGAVSGINAAFLGQGGVSGTGKLLTITFKAKLVGVSVLNLGNLHLGDPSGETILHRIATGRVTVVDFPAWDVNGDGSVNIFDLILVAQNFGKQSLPNPRVDVKKDGVVNIFDLILVAQHFGETANIAAPTMLAKELTFTTQQKRSIQSAIVELKDMLARSDTEELVFNLLQAILPERLPEQTQLLPNYPNPFNPETWLPFELSQDSKVSVTIYNVAGTPVRAISMGYLQAGRYVSQSRAIYWDGKTDTSERVASGTYFYTLKTQDYTSTQKMIILK